MSIANSRRNQPPLLPLKLVMQRDKWKILAKIGLSPVKNNRRRAIFYFLTVYIEGKAYNFIWGNTNKDIAHCLSISQRQISKKVFLEWQPCYSSAEGYGFCMNAIPHPHSKRTFLMTNTNSNKGSTSCKDTFNYVKNNYSWKR